MNIYQGRDIICQTKKKDSANCVFGKANKTGLKTRNNSLQILAMTRARMNLLVRI
jgi:hypothetical protein